jgi:hypothetical protein
MLDPFTDWICMFLLHLLKPEWLHPRDWKSPMLASFTDWKCMSLFFFSHHILLYSFATMAFASTALQNLKSIGPKSENDKFCPLISHTSLFYFFIFYFFLCSYFHHLLILKVNDRRNKY